MRIRCRGPATAYLGLLKQLGHFLLHAVGLGQGGDAGLAQDFVLGHVGGCGSIVGGLHRVLRRDDILLLRAEHLADCVERVDLSANVAILGRNIGDGLVERCERGLRVCLV